MQTITLHEVVDACLQGLKNDTLGAPHVPYEVDEHCLYKYPDGRRCAIGLAMDENTLAKLEDDDKLGLSFYAIENIYVRFNGSEAERQMVEDIQKAHDAWAGNGDDPGCRDAFLETLQSAAALIGSEGTA